MQEGTNKLGRAPKREIKAIRGQGNLTSEGNADRRLRDDLPTVFRGETALWRQLSTSTAGKTRIGELKCSAYR